MFQIESIIFGRSHSMVKVRGDSESNPAGASQVFVEEEALSHYDETHIRGFQSNFFPRGILGLSVFQ